MQIFAMERFRSPAFALEKEMRFTLKLSKDRNMSRHFGALTILVLSILLRIPAFFQEKGPYLFCDEQIYTFEALRMFELGTWITTEFKAGGINVYTILPLLHIANFFGLAPNSTNVIDIARVFQTLIIGGSTSVFIYLSAKKLFKSEAYGYVAGILFILSPGLYAYSRFAYPDHFIYFFSAGVLYFLIRYLDYNFKTDLILAAVFASLAFSVKYSGIFLFVPIILSAYLVARPKDKLLSRLKNSLLNLGWPLTIASFTLLVTNISALLQPKLFIAGVLSNAENYNNFSGRFYENVVYYLIASYGISFGLLSFPFILMGLLVQYRNNWNVFLILVSFPLALMFYLSTYGLALNRNISIVLPFIVIPLTASIKYLMFKFVHGGFKVRLIVSCAMILVIGFGTGQFLYSLKKDFNNKDSSALAHNWIDENLDRTAIIGINSACNGDSPAQNLGFETVYDPEISQQLSIYVLTSYWDHPFIPYYRDSRPYWLELDQKYIHFYHFSDKRIMVFPKNKPSIEELVPMGYVLEKSFESNGPDILILRKVTD